MLDLGGDYAFRLRGEAHAWTPQSVAKLQHAVRGNSLSDYKAFANTINDQIVSAVGMLDEAEAGWPSHVTEDLNVEEVTLDDEEIRERMSGNLCRCAAYVNIVPAISDVAP